MFADCGLLLRWLTGTYIGWYAEFCACLIWGGSCSSWDCFLLEFPCWVDLHVGFGLTLS